VYCSSEYGSQMGGEKTVIPYALFSQKSEPELSQRVSTALILLKKIY
jgi:hypothetical protein